MRSAAAARGFFLGGLTGLAAAVGVYKVESRDPEPEAAPSDSHLFRYGRPHPHTSTHTYTAHTVMYDRCRRVPIWSAESVSRATVKSTVAKRKHSKFQQDPDIPSEFSSANEDFRGSGWSRGHMTPAGDCKHCQSSMDQTFYLTNIVPQDPQHNSSYWNRLEMYCRHLASLHGNVNITTGPLYLPYKDEESGKRFVKYEVIGPNSVAVPTHLFKIVIVEDEHAQPLSLGVFIVPNRPIGDEDLTRFQVSLEELESATGVKFHSKLDRAKIGDLCKTDSCKLMSLEKLAQFSYNSQLRSAQNAAELDKVWREISSRQHQPDERCKQLYDQRRVEFNTAK